MKDMKELPDNLQLFERIYGNDLPGEQYFIYLFGNLPSKLITKTFYKKEVIEYFINELKFVEKVRLDSEGKYISKSEKRLLVNKEMEIILHTEQNKRKGEDFISVEMIYNFDKGNINKQIDPKKLSKFIVESKKSNIHLVRADSSGLETEEFDLPIPECNIELNYGKEFLELHNTIVERLNTPTDKGIILFHGEPGTGKTTYIKMLTKLIKDKDILFIPPSMAESLSEPSFIPFLMDHRDSILLIEDAEQVIGDRAGSSNQAGVSNLLNLTDGILGDCLNIQVIATFNMDKNSIDPALLRKGRLICEHKFEKLSVDSTNKLLKHLKKNVTSDEELTLADIYNIEVNVNRSKASKPVGF